jgi:hypothetical protein
LETEQWSVETGKVGDGEEEEDVKKCNRVPKQEKSLLVL